MSSPDLTPLYYTDQQLSQMLAPVQDVGSNLSVPVSLQSVYGPQLEQQINTQNDTLPPLPAQGLAAGGLLRRFAKGGLAAANADIDDVLKNHTIGDQQHIAAAIEESPKIRKMFDVGEPAHEDVGETLSQYNSPVGSEYLGARDKLMGKKAGGIIKSYHLHDLVNDHYSVDGSGLQTPDPVHLAAGGRVPTIAHRFKHAVPLQTFVKGAHYRQTIDNPGLTKVRTDMRIR